MRSVEPGEIETAWVAYVDAHGVARDMISQRIREIYKGLGDQSVTNPAWNAILAACAKAVTCVDAAAVWCPRGDLNPHPLAGTSTSS